MADSYHNDDVTKKKQGNDADDKDCPKHTEVQGAEMTSDDKFLEVRVSFGSLAVKILK